MNRQYASELLRKELDSNQLTNWSIRITTDPNKSFLGLCSYKDKCIILNAFHIDMHPDNEVIDTIKHEVAHALTPNQGHNEVWITVAKQLGCTNTLPCFHLSLNPEVIDAIRSSANVEMTVIEETHVIQRPQYKITRLQDKCPTCGKIAKELFSKTTLDNRGEIKTITLECFHIIERIIPKATPFESFVTNEWKDSIKLCNHEWTKNKCNKCGEFKLFNFQVEGCRALEVGLSSQKGFGLFHDMGLGKTLMPLVTIKHHPELTPTLVVVKSAIKFNWMKQIIRCLGYDYLPQVLSTSRDYVFPNLKMYIISYDLLKRFPKNRLEKIGIKCIILDECQQIKNPDSARTQELRKLVSSKDCKIIPLSGTPWKNRGGEFFPVLNMIDPIKFYSYQGFLDKWVDFYWNGNKKKMGGIRQIEKFKEYTSSLLLRREFNEVMDEFPEINRMKLSVQLDNLSQSSYDDEVSDFVKWYNNAVLEGSEDSLNGLEILAKLSRMRHITGLAKIPATLGFIEEFIEETDKKLVVFVHHKDVGHILYESLIDVNNEEWGSLAQEIQDKGTKVVKLTAEFSDDERFQIQESFNKTEHVIMIASTLASGEGIDLQTCADAVMHERQWNPQNEDQAAPGRFRRIGQLSPVINITFIEADGTVDEHLDGIIEEKRLRFHEVMNKGELLTWNQGDIGKRLAEIIVAKHNQKHPNKKETKITNQATLVKR